MESYDPNFVSICHSLTIDSSRISLDHEFVFWWRGEEGNSIREITPPCPNPTSKPTNTRGSVSHKSPKVSIRRRIG